MSKTRFIFLFFFIFVFVHSNVLADDIDDWLKKLASEEFEKDRIWRDLAYRDLKDIRSKIIDKLIEIVKTGKNEAYIERDGKKIKSFPPRFSAKHYAIKLLGEYRDREAIPVLLENLTYANRGIYNRWSQIPPIDFYPAANSLVQIGLPAIDPVINHLARNYEDKLHRALCFLILKYILPSESIIIRIDKIIGGYQTRKYKENLKKSANTIASSSNFDLKEIISSAYFKTHTKEREEYRKYLDSIADKDKDNDDDDPENDDPAEDDDDDDDDETQNNNAGNKTLKENKTLDKTINDTKRKTDVIESSDSQLETKKSKPESSKMSEKTHSKSDSIDYLSIKPVWVIAIIGLLIIGLQIIIIFRRR